MKTAALSAADPLPNIPSRVSSAWHDPAGALPARKSAGKGTRYHHIGYDLVLEIRVAVRNIFP